MEIKLVTSDKKEFLDLLLLADEQESMIDRYLERGDMSVSYTHQMCIRDRHIDVHQYNLRIILLEHFHRLLSIPGMN